MMPPTAGETQTSTSPTCARIFAASAAQRRSQRSGCMKTRFFCRKTPECRPDERMKCPSRNAPEARNSARTSSFVMGWLDSAFGVFGKAAVSDAGRLAQGLVDPALPAGPAGAEALQHVAIEAQRYLLLRRS